MIKVRLVKVIVQPIFVADDGENLRELPVSPKDVSASEWATYPAEAFSEAMSALEASLNETEELYKANREAFE